MIFILDKICVYNETTNETLLYGQYTKKFIKLDIDTKIEYSILYASIGWHYDFIIKFKEKINLLSYIKFYFDNLQEIEFTNIKLEFPLEKCNLMLDKNKSAIISTICKDYSHRLDEWIQYNLQLGFSGIVIYDNDNNKTNGLHEPITNCIITKTTKEICEKYKEKVFRIECPYEPFPTGYWTDIQRLTLSIGVNMFKDKCKFITIIDADEFIYTPRTPNINIEEFLDKYNNTLTMQSNILTNKNSDDIIDNNILDISKYIGENLYTKTILYTNSIKDYEFISTPHTHPSQIVMDKADILHYHCWVNQRYEYKAHMQEINIKPV
jgi:hypothetical protein